MEMVGAGAKSRLATLHAAWLRADLSGVASSIAEQMPVPGALALRCRYEALSDGHTTRFERSAFDLSVAQWERELDLLDRGDQALKVNDTELARTNFRALIDCHTAGQHPISVIDGTIGVADADRQEDLTDPAIAGYSKALTAARDCGYTYGQVRAGIPLGYLHLRSASAARAVEEFSEAYRLARVADWRLDAANALTGLGEAYQRLGQPIVGMRNLLDALAVFESLSSTDGVANATMQLGEISRRALWWEDARGWYAQSAASSKGRVAIAHANALDGLGEAQLESGSYELAVASHNAAYKASGSHYPRGRAHALNGLARCAVSQRDWGTAIGFFEEALELYLQIDDPQSAAYSEVGLARCLETKDDFTSAVQHRLSSVRLIESIRAAQLEHTHQSEYFDRFSPLHEAALRTAVFAGDPAAFISIFESIAGRRLAGLMTEAPGTETTSSRLSESIERANERVGLRRDRARTLSRLGLHEPAKQSDQKTFDDAVARLYTPFDHDKVESLWARVDTGDAHLLLVTVVSSTSQLAWFLKRPHGKLHVGLHDLTPATVDLIKLIFDTGLPLGAGPDFVAPLADLLPSELWNLIEHDATIVIVPAGTIWAIPWPAVPVPGGEFLGERNPLCLSPSVTAVGHTSGGLRTNPGPNITHWTSPLVRQHKIAAFADHPPDSTSCLESAEHARQALLSDNHDFVVVLAHGRLDAQQAHYIELDERTKLTPADLLSDGSTPPQAIALLSCWGAQTPDRGSGDPLTVATLALACGTRMVAATTSELLDDSASSAFVNQFLHATTTSPMPLALQRATRRWLSRPDYRSGRLSRWAPLITLGSW